MGYDDISMWVISRSAEQVVKPLVNIFKLSFSMGILPSNMKIERLYNCLKMEISQTSLTIVQFHFYHSSRRYWKIIQRATTTIREYKIKIKSFLLFNMALGHTCQQCILLWN